MAHSIFFQSNLFLNRKICPLHIWCFQGQTQTPLLTEQSSGPGHDLPSKHLSWLSHSYLHLAMTPSNLRLSLRLMPLASDKPKFLCLQCLNVTYSHTAFKLRVSIIFLAKFLPSTSVAHNLSEMIAHLYTEPRPSAYHITYLTVLQLWSAFLPLLWLD